MNAAIKQRWLEALRSGRYEQGTDYLNREGRLCCLGVLCEIAVADGVIRKSPPSEEFGLVQYGIATSDCDQSETSLPMAVMTWAGIPAELRSEVRIRIPGGQLLSRYNDKGSTFAEIADLIEEHL